MSADAQAVGQRIRDEVHWPVFVCRSGRRPATRWVPSLKSASFEMSFFKNDPSATPEQTITRATELINAFGTDGIMFIFNYGPMPTMGSQHAVREIDATAQTPRRRPVSNPSIRTFIRKGAMGSSHGVRRIEVRASSRVPSKPDLSLCQRNWKRSTMVPR